MKNESLTVDFKKMQIVEAKENDIEVKKLSDREAYIADIKNKINELGFDSFAQAFKWYQDNSTENHAKVVLIKKNKRITGIAEKIGKYKYEINEIEFISLLSDLVDDLGGV